MQLNSIPVTLIYPTTATARSLTQGPFTFEVAVDAPAADRVHRLIVMSHGTGGSGSTDHALAAALAQAGFVVAQPLHQGDNYTDMSNAGPVSFARRPQEVSRVIDALSQDNYWSQRLDLSKVGVHGMSAGGVTGLSLAGAQWRLLNLLHHCAAHLQEDEGFCLNGATTTAQRNQRIAGFQRATSAPEEYLPEALKMLHGGRTPDAADPGGDPRPDRRIGSVTLAVPVAAIFSAESLARIRIPLGVVSATEDLIILPKFHSDRVLKLVPGSKELMRLPAGHFDLLWPWPESIAKDVAAQQIRGGLPTPGFNPALRDAAWRSIVEFHRRNLTP